jgi:Cu2+-exporting ATPase
MLTETAAIKLKLLDEESTSVAESLARRLSECGFPTKKRESGLGVAVNVRKWKELVKKKEELLAKSRNRVAFAWTLVALCCGSHASHIFHSLGIHIAHGNVQIKYAISSAFCNQIQRLKYNFVLSFSFL